MSDESSKQASFAAEVPRAQKRNRGRTAMTQTPLTVRTTGVDVRRDFSRRVRMRLGARLGKYGGSIERASVRFEDVNGPRGGADTVCRVKIVLSRLSTVVVEERGISADDAFGRAADRVTRRVRRAILRAREQGFASQRPRYREGRRRSAADRLVVPARRRKRRPLSPPEDGSLIGRRVGRGPDNVARAADRPEKRRRDLLVDTALPGWSATDRRAGGSSTAARNVRLNVSKTTSALEDSVTDRPSRKSTRRSANRSKRDANLRGRQMRRVSSASAQAKRAAAHSR